MKILNGICVVAVLLAGAAPSFATALAPGGVVAPAVVPNATFTGLASSGIMTINTGGDTGQVLEYVGNFANNPFGAGDISFYYEIEVTGGHIVNLTTESFAIPGIMLDVAQVDAYLASPQFSGTLTPAVSASLTSDGTTLGFGFTDPDGLTPGMTSYSLLINTNLTTYQAGVFSLQDGQTQNFDGFVPASVGPVPEPGSLALLGTGLLACGQLRLVVACSASNCARGSRLSPPWYDRCSTRHPLRGASFAWVTASRR